jgi:Zn-finger nucleic acid-binding protein
MDCPVCNVQLKKAERQGVEINYCPDCRGVWIDHGGLDKLIDRAGAFPSESQFSEGERQHSRHDRYQESQGRRKSFFSNLFD